MRVRRCCSSVVVVVCALSFVPWDGKAVAAEARARAGEEPPARLASQPDLVPALGNGNGVRFRVRLSHAATDRPLTGRLLVYVSPGAAGIQMGIDWHQTVSTFAVDAVDFEPGSVRELDETASAYPGPLSSLETGEYQVMAVLHCDPDSNEPGKGVGDLTSEPKFIQLDALLRDPLELELTTVVSSPPAPVQLWMEEVAVDSPLLSVFHGRAICERATVILPPSYDKFPSRRYPVIYCIPSFQETHRDTRWAQSIARRESSASRVEAICVVLNGHCQWGHHVFANSATNGPRGDAFVREFVPWIDQKFRTVPEATARFIAGHGAGGWASLWLQINYPDAFGGAWASAPDPVDFRWFWRVNLYADPPECMFADAGGRRRILTRLGHESAVGFSAPLWADRFFRLDDCLGRGGQIRSCEAAFSPRGSDGEPCRLWNRVTGRTDPEVAKAWQQYDIRLLLEEKWETLGPRIQGKLHVVAGREDSLYRDGSVALLADSLRSLGSDALVEITAGDGQHNQIDVNRLMEQVSRGFLAHHADVYQDDRAGNADVKPSAYVLERIRESDGKRLDLGLRDNARWQVRVPRVTDGDLAHISRLSHFSELVLSYGNVTAAGMRHLANLEHLAALDLGHTAIDDECLPHLAGCVGLQVLNLEHTAITDAGINQLQRLTQLRSLNVAHTAVGDESAKVIGRFAGLERLNMQHTRVTDAGLSHLAGLTNLADLNLAFTQVSDRGLEQVSQRASLRNVDLSSTLVGDDGLDHLRGLVGLERVNVANTFVTADGVSRFQQAVPQAVVAWENLRNSATMSYVGIPVDEAALRYLGRAPSVVALTMSNAYDFMNRPPARGIGLKGVTQLPNLRESLRELHLLDLQLDEDDWRHIAELSHVESILLRRTVITDAGLENLTRLQNLRNLSSPSATISDEGLACLVRLERLASLDLSMTEVSDRGLKHLQGLDQLEVLDLSGCALITDAGLQDLSGLKSLRKLGLTRTAVSPAGVAQLKAAMPGCQIDVPNAPDERELQWYRPLPALSSDEGKALPQMRQPAGEDHGMQAAGGPPDAAVGRTEEAPGQRAMTVLQPPQELPSMAGEYVLGFSSTGMMAATTFFSDDGSWLLVDASPYAGMSQLWDLRGERPVRHGIELPRLLPQQARFSPDGRWLVVFEGDPASLRPRIFNLMAAPMDVAGTRLEHEAVVGEAVFTADSRWLITRSRQDNRFWNIRAPTVGVAPLVLGGPQETRQWGPFCPSPDGRWLVAAGRLFDLTAENPLASPLALPVEEIPRFLQFSDDGKRCLVGTLLLDLTQIDPVANAVELSIDSRAVVARFSAANRWLAAGSPEQTQIFDLTAPKPAEAVTSLPGPGGGQIRLPLGRHFELSFSPNQHWLVTATADGEMRLVRLSGDQPSSSILPNAAGDAGKPHHLVGRLIRFSADGRWLIVQTRTALRLWDLLSPHPAETPLSLVEDGTVGNRQAHLSPNGRLLLLSEPNKTMRLDGVPAEYRAQLWDLSRDPFDTSPFTLPEKDSYGGVYSADGHWLVTTTSLQDMPSFDLDDSIAWFFCETSLPPTPTPLRLLGSCQRRPPGFSVFSSNSRWLLTVGRTGLLRLWDMNLLKSKAMASGS